MTDLSGRVDEAIQKNSLLQKGQRVIAGFSGGADSCTMLFILKRLGYEVLALHVNHGIRGGEANRDEAFSRAFCKMLDVPFYCEHLNIPAYAKLHRLSEETAARIERHRVLKEYSESFSCPVALAHNKDDQAETVLMHLFRGSGLNGLCGIKYKSDFIIRPLLSISRSEIEAFCRENSIAYVTDSTNLSDKYSRNSVRHSVIPTAKKIYPDALNAIAACADRLTLCNDYIEAEAERLFNDFCVVSTEGVYLTVTPMHPFMRRGLIKKAIVALNGNAVDIDFVHIEAVEALFLSQSGKEVYLPHSIRARRVYGKILFFYDFEAFNAEYPFVVGKEYPWTGASYVCARYVEARVQGGECVDAEKLPENCVIRTRKSGDKIKIINSSGFCTLKEYFIDKKIPAPERNTVPLLASGSTVFAVIGHTVADSVKITDSTKKIINIYKGEKI